MTTWPRRVPRSVLDWSDVMSRNEDWSDIGRLLDGARQANQRGDRAAVETLLAAAREAHRAAQAAPTPLGRALMDERFGRGPVFA